MCVEGNHCYSAAVLAVENINCDPSTDCDGNGVEHLLVMNSGDIDYYCLILEAVDSENDAGRALKAGDDFMNTPWTDYANIDLFIADLSSGVTESFNQMVQHNAVPQISYGATADSLSSVEKHPTFYRTIPADVLLVDAVTSLVETLEWEIVSILAAEGEAGLALSSSLYKQLSNSEKLVSNNLLFTEENIPEKLATIRESESRIIFLHCTTAQVQLVFEWASKMGMLEEGYAWLGSDWATPSLFDEFTDHEDVEPWPSPPVSRETLLEEMPGIVALRASDQFVDETLKTTIVDYVLEDDGLPGALCSELQAAEHMSPYALFAYDAVILGATALGNSINDGNDPWDFAATQSHLQQLGSAGVSGCVTQSTLHLDSNGDRSMPYDVVNLWQQDWADPALVEEVEWLQVGIYLEDDGSWELSLDGGEMAIKWPGGSTEIPSDRKEEHVSLAALYLFFFLSFIIISICVGNFLHAHEFYVLPESGATILFGLILGGVLSLYSDWLHYNTELIEMTEFDTEIFSLFLLPVIIFAAGFNLRKSDFFNNLGPICLCAFIGTGISTVFVGLGVYYMGDWGWFNFGKLGGAEALAFGALISAVDPVATLAVFGALGVETDLNMRVFGESVINDGVSIVLFKVMEKFITEEVTTEEIGNGVLLFVRILFGSIAIGMLSALVLAFVMKHARLHAHILEAAMVLIGSYTAYAGAEAIHCSGIIASLFCGIAMNHWTYHNFTYDGEMLSRRTVKMFSLLADTVIFFQVGQNIIVNVVDTDWNFIGITLFLCFIGRILNIVPLLSLYNLCAAPERKVSYKHMIVMIHAGLRGAIAFALALKFPSQHIHVVINTTMWVILFTIFVMGGSCVSMLQAMDVTMGVDSNDVSGVKKSKHSKEFHNSLQKFDRTCLLPCVTWRFESNGNDTYIENPEEARAFRKGIPWEQADH